MNSILMLKRYCEELNCKATVDEPMSLHSTFKIGGPADIFIAPDSEQKIGKLIYFLKEHEIPYYVFGKGSNILVSDKGIRGAVLYLGQGISNIKRKDDTIECEAGTPLARLCYFAYEEGLSGLEFAWGIPGSSGGAAYMNAGAYGGEMSDVLHSCRHIDEDGLANEFFGNALDLSYRHSVYSNKKYCITSIKVRLKAVNKTQIKEVMDDLLNRRTTKQPLEFPSAGSTFKRPEGNYASALIEQCGLKGRSVGGARVSTKHSGFVINNGNATCNDVLKLIEIVKEEVFTKTGVLLECEIKFICC